MPLSDQRHFGLAIPCSSDPDSLAHERSWLGHVRAGRIGSSDVAPGGEQDFLERMAAMERAVLGEVRSVKRVLPEVPRRG
jgi:hypothetical protein